METREKKRRGKERLVIEPTPFGQLSEEFQEQLRGREVLLRSAGLWSFLWELELPWPRQADAVEFVESGLASSFEEIIVQKQHIPLTTEVIAEVTTLP